jgi:hypothetical protein
MQNSGSIDQDDNFDFGSYWTHLLVASISRKIAIYPVVSVPIDISRQHRCSILEHPAAPCAQRSDRLRVDIKWSSSPLIELHYVFSYQESLLLSALCGIARITCETFCKG